MSSENSEQYKIYIEKLNVEEERSVALNDLKILLTYKPASEAVTIIRSMGISKIIHCFNSPDK